MPRRTHSAARGGSRRKPRRTGTRKVGGFRIFPKFITNSVARTATSAYNVGNNVAKNTSYSFNFINSAVTRINDMNTASPERIKRIGMKNIMLMYLVITGCFNMAWIPTVLSKQDSDDEIDTLSKMIIEFFGRDIGNLEYITYIPKGVIVYNKAKFKPTKTYTQDDLDKYMNSLMGLNMNSIENIDTKNSLFMSNKFVITPRDTNISSDKIVLLTIPSARGSHKTKNYLNLVRNSIQNLLTRVRAFNTGTVSVETFSDMSLKDLVAKLSKPCSSPKNHLGENGELSVRNYMIKLFKPNDEIKNYEPPSESVYKQLGVHMNLLRATSEAGRTRTDSMNSIEIIIHYRYTLDKNDIQRGVVMCVLENINIPGFKADETYADNVLILLDKTVPV